MSGAPSHLTAKKKNKWVRKQSESEQRKKKCYKITLFVWSRIEQENKKKWRERERDREHLVTSKIDCQFFVNLELPGQNIFHVGQNLQLRQSMPIIIFF